MTSPNRSSWHSGEEEVLSVGGESQVGLLKEAAFPGKFYFLGNTAQESKHVSLKIALALGIILKPRNSGWDLNPCAGIWTRPQPWLGLEPTVF